MATMITRAENGLVVTEHPMPSLPGWIQIQYHTPEGVLQNRRYRSPDGVEMGKKAYATATRNLPKRGRPNRQNRPVAAPRAHTAPATPASAGSPPILEVPEVGPVPALEPEPLDIRADKGRSGGQASGSELATTAAMGLIVVSSLVALLTGAPEMAMTQDEAQGIGVPLGNILAKSSLNKRYGHLIAGSGDYTALGYGLYAYAYRVGGAIAARKQQEAFQQRAAPANVGPAMPQRGSPVHVVSPQPAQPGPTPAAGAVGTSGEQRAQPASGGIGAVIAGNVPAESSRFVGHNPITRAGGAA